MKILIFILSLIPSSSAFGASCCGGGFSIPALILGDDKAQLTSTYSYSHVSDDVLGNGRWLKRNDENLSQTLKLEGATLFSDSWQGGFSLPLITKSAEGFASSSGVGDVSLYLGHESFPETSYSPWKPKGLTFIQLNLPTSPSIYDFSATDSNESRGRGFYSLGAGMALVKSWIVWDAHWSGEIHHSFARRVSNPSMGENLLATPGWGHSQTVGLGWNKKDFRLGTSLSFMHEDPIRIEGGTSSEGSAQRNFTLALSGSYMLNLESAITASYSDQSLIGNPSNSSLSKTINLSYQTRWPR